MTFASIYNEAINLRFNSTATKLAQVKNWVTAREGEVWQAADWPIKDSVQLSLTVTGGTATVPLPSGMTWTSQGIDVYDNYGAKLDYLAPDDFFAAYGAASSSPVASGTPAAWTLTTDPTASGALVFRVGPTSSSSTTFSVSGWNLPIKRTAAAVWATGTMSGDTDLPWWPDAFHYFLVEGTIALGKRLEGDPSWQQNEQAFQTGLDRLRRELMPLERASLEQWGDYWSEGGY